MASLCQSRSLLISCWLYYFSLYDDYPQFLYTMRSIHIAALSFLINWNEKWCSESNILTVDHKLVCKNSSSAPVYTLQNTINYFKAIKYWVSDWDRSIKRSWNLRNCAKDWESNAILWLWGFETTVLEIKSNVIVIFLIFLNHNGLCGRVKNISQLWQADSSSGQLTVFTIYSHHLKEHIKSSKHKGKKEMDKLANSKNLK